MNTKFSDAIIVQKKKGITPVIPDIKCVSPKEGDLLCGRDPVKIAQLLTQMAGAPVLSVVTEPKEFGGSIELLKQVKDITNCPVLRKDFIESRADLLETKKAGADAVLLMCAVLPENRLKEYYEMALELDLEPLVETHTKEEMLFAKELGAGLVGINNRDILSLEKDEGTVLRTDSIAVFKPENSILISESSIQSREDVETAVRAGADAALVGTAIWKAEDMVSFYHTLCGMKK